MENRNVIINLLKRRERRRARTEAKMFESVSIADMAFLLLIFFIVTGSFVLRQGIFFSLPSKSAGAVTLEEKLIVEVYPRNEGFMLGGELLGRDRFKEVLRAREKAAPGTVLMIFMDPKVRYERLVDTLSVARETGVARVSLKNTGKEGRT